MPLLLLVRRFGCIARGKSLVTWRLRSKLREPTLFLAQTPYPMPPAHKVSLRVLLRPPPQRRSPKPTHLVRSIRPERRLPPELSVLPLCPAQLAVPRLGPPAAAVLPAARRLLVRLRSTLQEAQLRQRPAHRLFQAALFRLPQALAILRELFQVHRSLASEQLHRALTQLELEQLAPAL